MLSTPIRRFFASVHPVRALLFLSILLAGLFLGVDTAGSKVPGKVDRLLDAGEVSEAIGLLEERARKKPDEADVYVKLADIYHDYSSIRSPHKELYWLRKAQTVYRASGESALMVELNRRLQRVATKVDDLDFEDAVEEGTQKAYQTYIRVHDDGSHVGEAHKSIDRLDYRDAKRAGTVASYEAYLAEHGSGLHATDAKHAIQDIHAEKALAAGTEQAYRAYLDSDLGHAYHARADVQGRLYGIVTSDREKSSYERYIPVHGDHVESIVLKLVDRAYGCLWEMVDPESRARVLAYIDSYPKATNMNRAQEALFQTFAAEGRESSLAKFIKEYPDSPQLQTAETLLYETYYDNDDIASLKSYVSRYADSSRTGEATLALHRLEFDAAVASNDADKIIKFVQTYPGATQVEQAEKKIFSALKRNIIVEMKTRTSYSKVYRDGYDYTTVDRSGWDDEVTGSTRHQQAGYEETVADGSYVELSVRNNNRHPLLVKVWAGHYTTSSGWGGTSRSGDSESWKIVVGPSRGSVVQGYLSNVTHEAEWQIKGIKVLSPREYSLYRQCESNRTISNHRRFLNEFPSSDLATDIRASYKSLVKGLVDYDAREHREKGNSGWYATYRNKSGTYTVRVRVQGQTFTMRPGARHQLDLVRKYPSPDSVEIVK